MHDNPSGKAKQEKTNHFKNAGKPTKINSDAIHAN